MTVSLDHFQQIDMRVGRIVEVEDFPDARKPSYKLTIEFGKSIGTRRSSAMLVPYYTKDELMGRQVVCVLNFPPLRIAGFQSEVLVLGAMQTDGRVVLLQPDRESQLGVPIA